MGLFYLYVTAESEINICSIKHKTGLVFKPPPPFLVVAAAGFVVIYSLLVGDPNGCVFCVGFLLCGMVIFLV